MIYSILQILYLSVANDIVSSKFGSLMYDVFLCFITCQGLGSGVVIDCMDS